MAVTNIMRASTALWGVHSACSCLFTHLDWSPLLSDAQVLEQTYEN